MSSANNRAHRMMKELRMIEREPPPGVCAWPVEDRLNRLQAQISGPPDTPYESGVFKLDVDIPDRYPLEPPKMRFTTPIYHPNIDNGGRICLDTLKMPPKGSWTPSLNLSSVLTMVRLLLAHPNPDDGLMVDITEQYRRNKPEFLRIARARTLKHATGAAAEIGSTPDIGSSEGVVKATGGVAADSNSHLEVSRPPLGAQGSEAADSAKTVIAAAASSSSAAAAAAGGLAGVSATQRPAAAAHSNNKRKKQAELSESESEEESENEDGNGGTTAQVDKRARH